MEDGEKREGNKPVTASQPKAVGYPYGQHEEMSSPQELSP